MVRVEVSAVEAVHMDVPVLVGIIAMVVVVRRAIKIAGRVVVRALRHAIRDVRGRVADRVAQHATKDAPMDVQALVGQPAIRLAPRGATAQTVRVNALTHVALIAHKTVLQAVMAHVVRLATWDVLLDVQAIAMDVAEAVAPDVHHLVHRTIQHQIQVARLMVLEEHIKGQPMVLLSRRPRLLQLVAQCLG